MDFARSVRWLPLLVALLGCGPVADDLRPDGDDLRPGVQAGTTGPAVGQDAPAFTLTATTGAHTTLHDELSAGQPVVLYFTMWCPVCDGHMSHLRGEILPAFPGVTFWVVDYVTGSVAGARDEALANGYGGAGFTVLADTDTRVLDAYDATMGSTVVIDPAGVIRMNEDYKDGARLRAVLEAL